MLVVALTGGIGSGKSTVAHLFAEKGIPIIDADLIAREVTQPGTPALTAIAQHFDTTLLLPDGSLDRRKLRQIVFDQASERRWLENLLHPLIIEKIKERIHDARTTSPYCIAVVPLLLEVKPFALFGRILVVDTPEDLQAQRVASRDNADKDQIDAILKTQASRHERLARADDVIFNNLDKEDLVPQVDRLHEMYLEMSKRVAKLQPDA